MTYLNHNLILSVKSFIDKGSDEWLLQSLTYCCINFNSTPHFIPLTLLS